MLTRRMTLVGALGVMLGALPTARAAAQYAPRPVSWLNTPPALEASYTQMRLDEGGRSQKANGVGARLMWNLAPDAGRDAGLLARTDVGLYTAFTPTRTFGTNASFSTVAAGAVADLRPLPSLLFGRVDPFVSLGAGVLHTNVARPVTPAPSPLLAGSQTAFTLTPGAGVRVPLTRDLAVQGDLRDFVTFRNDTRHNVAFGAGLRLTL